MESSKSFMIAPSPSLVFGDSGFLNEYPADCRFFSGNFEKKSPAKEPGLIFLEKAL